LDDKQQQQSHYAPSPAIATANNNTTAGSSQYVPIGVPLAVSSGGGVLMFEQELGRGAFGVVFAATWNGMNEFECEIF
jgi:hypothetical protein